MANIAALLVLAFCSYSYGNTYNIFRATDNNSNICGQTPATVSYPYSYFYNPTTSDLSNRVCVKSCPTFDSSGTLTTLDCKTNSKIDHCTYDSSVGKDGKMSGTPSKTDLIGYDSTVQIGRICIPTITVLQNAFSAYATNISDGVRQAGLANFIPDIQNVRRR